MVYFPSGSEWHDKEDRNAHLLEDYYSGKFEISDLALKYNISISRVYKIIEKK
jgi:Mor family transcriptional regulator